MTSTLTYSENFLPSSSFEEYALLSKLIKLFSSTKLQTVSWMTKILCHPKLGSTKKYYKVNHFVLNFCFIYDIYGWEGKKCLFFLFVLSFQIYYHRKLRLALNEF